MKTPTDLYSTTVYGRGLKRPNITDSQYRALDDTRIIKFTNSRMVDELLQAAREQFVSVIGPKASFAELVPLAYPLELEGERVLVDLRNYTKATDKYAEDRGEIELKSGAFETAFSNLLLGITTKKMISERKREDMLSLINSDVIKAYVSWMSSTISRQVGIASDFPILQRLRAACGVYFLIRSNLEDEMGKHYMGWIHQRLLKTLRIDPEVYSKALEIFEGRGCAGIELHELIDQFCDDPRTSNLTEPAIVQLASSHLYLSNTNTLIMAAVNSPVAFCVAVCVCFNQDLRIRSNFNTMMQNSGDADRLKNFSKHFTMEMMKY